MRYLALLVVGVVACGGSKAAQTSPRPSDGARTLTAVDPDLSSLAKAAATALRPATDGRVRFGGVSVGGRILEALSDTVSRAIGATRVGDPTGKVSYTIGRLGSGAGAAANRDATYLMMSFRVKDDMGFVGVDARSAAEPDGGLCIVLVRAGAGWLIKQTSATRTPKSCGPLVI